MHLFRHAFGTIVLTLAQSRSVRAAPRDYNQFKTCNITIPRDAGGGEYSRYIQPAIQCLLQNASEYTKVNLSVSQLILGLAPTILAFAGASSLETSLVAIIGKRPLLAAILALGSPSIYINRAFEYPNPREILTGRDGRYRQNWNVSQTRLRRYCGRSLVAFQYVLAIAAVANVALVNWDLGTQAICMLTPSFIYYPTAWAIIGLTVHVVGAVILRLRARRMPTSGPTPLPEPVPPRFRGLRQHWFSHHVALEFSLLGKQEGSRPVYVHWIDESVVFLVIAWFHSLLCIAHLIFGTIIFSGMIFIGPLDAFLVFVRYAASCLVCRIVLTFELAGLREAYNAGLLEDLALAQPNVIGSGKQRGD